MLNIASVVLSAGLRSFDKLYDYIIPDNLSALPGMRVLVPFGAKNRLCSAWIVQVRQDEATRALKEIHSLVDDYPLLNQEMLKLSEWMKNRYLCTWGEAIGCMVPAGVNLTRQRIVKSCIQSPSEEMSPIMARLCEAGDEGVL
ncbi:MAG TPA: primosomal protein N', partial [Thermoclostridium caenicola]|nr:primosomal protein N' [Thermoclostridium caenicola]